MEVKVRDNNVMQAFRKLKKKLYDEGVIQDIKDRSHFVKPSEKKRLKKKASIRAQKRAAAKRASM